MKDLEKQIKDAAKELVIFDGKIDHAKDNIIAEIAFINGAKSKAAKDFHQQGMYTEDEVRKITLYAAENAQDNHMKFPYEWFDKWFEQNKKQ